MTLLQGIRPPLTSNCPRGNELLDTGRLNVPRNIVHPPNMIHTILWHALPHCAPGHWAPPQLCQVQVKLCHMPIHVALGPCAAVNSTNRPDGVVAWHPHASPPGPAGATPCDEGPQVATAGRATTTPEAKLTTQAHHTCRR